MSSNTDLKYLLDDKAQYSRIPNKDFEKKPDNIQNNYFNVRQEQPLGNLDAVDNKQNFQEQISRNAELSNTELRKQRIINQKHKNALSGVSYGIANPMAPIVICNETYIPKESTHKRIEFPIKPSSFLSFLYIPLLVACGIFGICCCAICPALCKCCGICSLLRSKSDSASYKYYSSDSTSSRNEDETNES